jgi:hypothetical protein
MVNPVETKTTEGRGLGGSRLARAEGYPALSFVFVSFLGPLLPPLPGPVGLAVGVSIWACGWLFAISGVRRGRGGARVAALVSLVILVLHAAVLLLIAWH